MAAASLRLLIFGAHPDDAEFHAGGLATIYRKHGHQVRMVSVTDGAAGHHHRSPEQLRRLRKEEAAASAGIIGASSDVWHYPDGQLQPILEVRHDVIRAIRSFRPDLVLTHRTNDYHPDHRAVGQAVQDASYLVTVPHIVPEVEALRSDPVVAYMPDAFTKPTPLQPDVVVDIDGYIDTVVQMLACHASQVFEWLPYLQGQLDDVPDDEAGRLALLRRWLNDRLTGRADRYRDKLQAVYGAARGAAIKYAEIFEISEYAAPLDAEARSRLFGFVP